MFSISCYEASHDDGSDIECGCGDQIRCDVKIRFRTTVPAAFVDIVAESRIEYFERKSVVT